MMVVTIIFPTVHGLHPASMFGFPEVPRGPFLAPQPNGNGDGMGKAGTPRTPRINTTGETHRDGERERERERVSE